MESFIIVVHVITAVLIVLFVLLQSGKGDMGSAFGAGGSSNSVLGTSGGANILQKTTAWLAVVFAVTSLSITIYKARQSRQSVFDQPNVPVNSAPNSATLPVKPDSVPAPGKSEPSKAPVEDKK